MLFPWMHLSCCNCKLYNHMVGTSKCFAFVKTFSLYQCNMLNRNMLAFESNNIRPRCHICCAQSAHVRLLVLPGAVNHGFESQFRHLTCKAFLPHGRYHTVLIDKMSTSTIHSPLFARAWHIYRIFFQGWQRSWAPLLLEWLLEKGCPECHMPRL